MEQSTFKKGMIVGGVAIFALAALGLVMTRRGKELVDDIGDEVEDDVRMVKRKLKKVLLLLNHVSRETYDTLVVALADEYAKKKKLMQEGKVSLISALKDQWEDMHDECCTTCCEAEDDGEEDNEDHVESSVQSSI